MNGFFGWCMRYGAAILFAVALLQLALGIIGPIYFLAQATSEMASDHSLQPSGMLDILHLQTVLSAISPAMFPFFGALLIDRLDRWLGRREAAL